MERTNWVKIIITLLFFIASVALVVVGQMKVGYRGLFMEIVGLTGLVVLLYLYNRQYK
ncbi:MAG: DUF6903 family protein [Anaerorhabdus sp.]